MTELRRAIDRETTLEDLMANPRAYGLPTPDEYRRNRTKFKEQFFGREDDEIAAIDRGDPLLGCRQKYFIATSLHTYQCKSLEDAQRIALDMGLNLFKDFSVDPQLRSDGTGGIVNHVTFQPKSFWKRLLL